MYKRYRLFLILQLATQVLTEDSETGDAAVDESQEYYEKIPAFDLHYWRVRGLGQPLREFAKYLGLDFNDITYERGDNDHFYWSDKEKAKDTGFPLINLPYIDDPKDTNDMVSESKAIMFWIIKKSNRLDMLSYENDFEAAIWTAQIEGVIEDLGKAYKKPCYMSKSVDELKATLNANVPKLKEFKWRGLSEALGDNGFLLGKDIKPLDFIFAELLRQVFTMERELGIEKGPSEFPNLVVYLRTYEEIPEIAEYMKSEIYIARPFNGKSAVWG